MVVPKVFNTVVEDVSTKLFGADNFFLTFRFRVRIIINIFINEFIILTLIV
jgi:hypothetical protein